MKLKPAEYVQHMMKHHLNHIKAWNNHKTCETNQTAKVTALKAAGGGTTQRDHGGRHRHHGEAHDARAKAQWLGHTTWKVTGKLEWSRTEGDFFLKVFVDWFTRESTRYFFFSGGVTVSPHKHILDFGFRLWQLWEELAFLSWVVW